MIKRRSRKKAAEPRPAPPEGGTTGPAEATPRPATPEAERPGLALPGPGRWFKPMANDAPPAVAPQGAPDTAGEPVVEGPPGPTIDLDRPAGVDLLDGPRSETADDPAPNPSPDPAPVGAQAAHPVAGVPDPETAPAPDRSPTVEADPVGAPAGAVSTRDRVSFWERYEGAVAFADLLAVPSVVSTAVVGRLAQAAPVARRHLDRQPADGRPVVVVSEHPTPDCVDDGWSVASSNEAIRSVFRDALVPPALLVIDTDRALPMPLAQTVDHLRQYGVELVRLVVDGSPNDEDMATWQGELGRPGVIDLASPIDPQRARQLLRRGEPIASIAGVSVTPELLLALELDSDSPAEG